MILLFTCFSLVLIRGICPESASYHKDDLVNHLSQIQGSIFDKDSKYLGCTLDSILADGDEREVTKDNIFTELFPTMFVESRNISLESMKEDLNILVQRQQQAKYTDSNDNFDTINNALQSCSVYFDSGIDIME